MHPPKTLSDLSLWGNTLANHRGDPSFKRWRVLLRNAYYASENLSYDFEANGERWLIERLAAFAPRTVFDVGANAGQWTAAALPVLPQATFHCFEPVHTTFNRLTTTLARESRAFLRPFGLSDQDGSAEVNYYPDSSEQSSLFSFPVSGPRQPETCAFRNGDAYLVEQQIERIEFLKIDAEGAESLVLRGFGRALAARRIDVVQFEYGRIAIQTRFLLADFYALLEGHGYVIGKLFPRGVEFRRYRPEHEDFLGPNFVAVRSDRRDLLAALTLGPRQ